VKSEKGKGKREKMGEEGFRVKGTWGEREGEGDRCILPFEAFSVFSPLLEGDFSPSPSEKASQGRDYFDQMDYEEEEEEEEEEEVKGVAHSIWEHKLSQNGKRKSKGKGKGREEGEERGTGEGKDASSLKIQPAQTSGRRKGQPLTLQFTNPHNGRKVYGGVLEFSAPEGFFMLPPYLHQALALKEGDTLYAKAVDLPKGTFARLQPLNPDYLEIPDFRAALESLLRRNFTTLTKGEIINLPHHGKKHEILVSDLKPSLDAVSIIGNSFFPHSSV